MLKRLAILALLPMTVQAACVLTDRTSTASDVQIQERSGMRRHVVPTPGLAGYRRCEVSFQARIGDRWYMASGYHDWPGDRPPAEACGIAQTRADSHAREQAGPSQVATHRTMVCTDRDDFNPARNVAVGVHAQLHQFRPHPNFPNEFWHNGTRCRWFTEPSFTGQDIHNYQGVICQIRKTEWVVVDKF